LVYKRHAFEVMYAIKIHQFKLLRKTMYFYIW